MIIWLLSHMLASAVAASAVTSRYRQDYTSTLDMVVHFPIPVPSFWAEGVRATCLAEIQQVAGQS